MSSASHVTIEETNGVHVCRIPFAHLFRADDIKSVETSVLALISAHPACKIAIDFGRVEVTGSRAFGVIVALHKAARVGGGALALFGVSQAIARVMGVMQLETLFGIHTSEAEALRALAACAVDSHAAHSYDSHT